MSDEVTRQMREQREDATDEVTALRKDRDHWKVEAEGWHATVVNTAKELGETQRLKDAAVGENKQLRVRAEKAESALEDLESASRDLIQAVNGQKQRAEHFSAVGDCLRKELDDAQQGCLKLGAEVIELREERDKWKVEAATRFNQIAGLNTKVNELKEEISHLRGLRRQNDAVIKELRMLVVAGLKG